MDGLSRRSRLARSRRLLDALATVAFIVTCAVVVWVMLTSRTPPTVAAAATAPNARPSRPAEPPLPDQPVTLEGAAVQGDRTAKVALIVYSDFQCPFCAKFGRDALPDIRTRYVKTGKVLLAFRQFPLTIHPFAQKAAEASECAARQGKFWDMHDLLFEHQQELTEGDLRAYARRVRLDGSVFDECLFGATSAKVRADADGGRQLAVTGTPTFLVGRIQQNGQVKVLQRFSGALPPSQFQAILDRALNTVDAPSAQN